MELNERYRIFKPGQRVLDLGAAPGGWTEVAVSATESKKESPTVFCVDIQSMIRIDGSLSIVSDLTEEECHNTLLNFVKSPVDVILNDMSIFTSRDRDIDCETQWSFCLDALRISNLLLKPGGLVLFKMYLGLEEPKHFVRSNQELMKKYFKDMERVKCTSSHPVEIYYLAKGWKLGEGMQEDVSKENLKDLTEKIFSAGLNSNKQPVDADLEAKIREEIGDFDKNNPNYEYLKDDDESVKQYSKINGNPSFNKEIPSNFSELSKIVSKIKKENAQPDQFYNEELEEIDYDARLSSDIQEILKEFQSSNVYTEDDAKEDFNEFQHEDFLKEKAGENMEAAFREMRENINSDTKKAKNNPSQNFEDWDDAGKDPEFWNNNQLAFVKCKFFIVMLNDYGVWAETCFKIAIDSIIFYRYMKF